MLFAKEISFISLQEEEAALVAELKNVFHECFIPQTKIMVIPLDWFQEEDWRKDFLSSSEKLGSFIGKYCDMAKSAEMEFILFKL